MKKYFLITAMVLLTTAWAIDAQAQWGRGRGVGRGMGPGNWNNMQGLNLSNDQMTSLSSLRQAFWKETASIKAELYQKRLQMDTLLLETEPDTAKAKKIQNEISGLKAQLDEKRVMYQLQARKNLTPEQIAQLPPGCSFGFGNMFAGRGRGCGPGCRLGYGYGNGPGCGMGPGFSRGW